MTIVIYNKPKPGKHHGKNTKKLLKLFDFFFSILFKGWFFVLGAKEGILYERFCIHIVNYVKLLKKRW